MGEKVNQNGQQRWKLRPVVFWPPWILLVIIVVVSFINNDVFLKYLDLVTNWILDNFSWGFNGLALFCVLTVVMVYFSPLGKVRVGGSKARPIMKYSSWLWITLTTTVAAGILFWACAEPLYHLYAPPVAADVVPGSPSAALFAIEVMFLEWTWSPYSLYRRLHAGQCGPLQFHGRGQLLCRGTHAQPGERPAQRRQDL